MPDEREQEFWRKIADIVHESVKISFKKRGWDGGWVSFSFNEARSDKLAKAIEKLADE